MGTVVIAATSAATAAALAASSRPVSRTETVQESKALPPDRGAQDAEAMLISFVVLLAFLLLIWRA